MRRYNVLLTWRNVELQHSPGITWRNGHLLAHLDNCKNDRLNFPYTYRRDLHNRGKNRCEYLLNIALYACLFSRYEINDRHICQAFIRQYLERIVAPVIFVHAIFICVIYYLYNGNLRFMTLIDVVATLERKQSPTKLTANRLCILRGINLYLDETETLSIFASVKLWYRRKRFSDILN